jgi:hypothetical protein
LGKRAVEDFYFVDAALEEGRVGAWDVSKF